MFFSFEEYFDFGSHRHHGISLDYYYDSSFCTVRHASYVMGAVTSEWEGVWVIWVEATFAFGVGPT
jgi:hypothetical protein